MAIPPSENPKISPANNTLASGITRRLLFALGIPIVPAGASFFTTVPYAQGAMPNVHAGKSPAAAGYFRQRICL